MMEIDCKGDNMIHKLVAVCFSSISLLAFGASLPEPVTEKTRLEFERLTPCPVQRIADGLCSGFITAYIDPLCHGGKDIPKNVKWLSMADLEREAQQAQALCPGGGAARTRNNTKSVAHRTHQAAPYHPHLAVSTSSTCYTGPRGGRYRIVNGRKRYDC